MWRNNKVNELTLEYNSSRLVIAKYTKGGIKPLHHADLQVGWKTVVILHKRWRHQISQILSFGNKDWKLQ